MRVCPKLSEEQLVELKSWLRSSKDGSEVKRIQAVILINTRQDPVQISSLTGYSRSRIFSLRKEYLTLGIESLKTKRKGEPKTLLTRKQLQMVVQTVKGKNPQDLGYQSKFWTTGILADWIEREFKVKYKSKTSYYVIFKRIKFTFHKPGRVFEKRDEKEVRKWKIEARKIIDKVWNDPEWVILASDEMILSTQTTFQKIWLPQGEYPMVEISNTRKNKSIYGFLNVKTGKEHAFLADWQNMHITRRILTRVRQIYPKNDNKINKLKGKHILLLWDNPGWHRGSEVTDYIRKDGKIQVLYFPKYSPEENPQEHVWKEGRNKVTHNQFIGNLDITAKNFVSYLNSHYFTYKLLNFSPL